MSSTIETAKRRSALLLATSFPCAEWLARFGANASRRPCPRSRSAHPTDPNKTRARPLDDDGSRHHPRPARTARPSRGAGTGTSDGASPGTADAGGTSTGGRQFNGIVGTASTVITAEDIAHSPSHNLPEIIAQAPGVQLTSCTAASTAQDLRRPARLRRVRDLQYA